MDVSCFTLLPAQIRAYQLMIFAPCAGERLKRLGIQHHDGAVFEANPIARRPGPQLLVDAFAGHADHLADFLLGDGDAAAALRQLVPFGQTNQRAGEPAWQILKDNLCDLVAGPSQARAEQLDEFHRQLRLASHKGKKFAAVDHENFAIGIGCGIGGPCLAVEQSDLAEDLAGTDEIQNRAAAVGRGDADLHRAADHRNQAVAGISLGEDRRPPLQRRMFGVTAKLVERPGIEIAENRMLAQHRQLVAREWPSFTCLVLRHADQISGSGVSRVRLRNMTIVPSYYGRACKGWMSAGFLPWSQTSER